MNRFPQRVRRVIGTLTMVAVGLAPFITYAAFRKAGGGENAPWPSPVALTSASGGKLTGIALLQPGNPQILVRFPLESLLDVPGGGRLRAATAYRVGGAALLARGLAATGGFAVPYWAHWTGPSIDSGAGAPSTNLGAHVPQVTALLATQGSTLDQLPAPGRVAEGSSFDSYVVDAAALRTMLGIVSRIPSLLPSIPPSPSITPSPSPTPSPTPSVTAPDPARITVVIFNQGAPSGSATRLSKRLIDKGFALTRVGDAPEETVTGNFVYYTGSRAEADLVARALGFPAPIAVAPQRYSNADVTVVLGRDRASSTRSPSSSPTTTKLG